MGFWLLGAGLCVASFLTSKIMLMKAVEIELLDKPNVRSSHSGNIPKGGGLVFASLFSGFALLVYLTEAPFKPYITAFLIAGPALFGLGWIDDRLHLSASIRLIFHFLVSGIVLFSLTKGFSESFQVLFFPDWTLVTLGFCLLYLVWFVNLYNFMDGADGIAGGGGLIGALVLCLVAYSQSAPLLGGTYFVLACCLSGFVFFNWNPAKFFMGDSGAYFLGITFAVLSLAGQVQDGLSLYPTIIIFGLFVMDATYTLIARVSQGHKPFAPHQQFGFHKLFKKGWSHARAAQLYLGITTLWLAPLAYASAAFPHWAFGILVLSYAPLLGFEVYIKAGSG